VRRHLPKVCVCVARSCFSVLRAAVCLRRTLCDPGESQRDALLPDARRAVDNYHAPPSVPGFPATRGAPASGLLLTFAPFCPATEQPPEEPAEGGEPVAEDADAAPAEGDAPAEEAPAEEAPPVPGGASRGGTAGAGEEAPAEEGGGDAPAEPAPEGAGEGEDGGGGGGETAHQEAAPAEDEAAGEGGDAGGGGGDAGGEPVYEDAGAAVQDGQGFDEAFDGNRTLPDAREIEVDIGNGAPPVIISLTIEHDLQRKPYYGGYRHKLTGVEYHHATCQTEVPPKPKRKTEDMLPPKFHRETQTRKIKEQAQQAVREFGTQMTREDHFVDVRADYIIEPRAYLDAAHYAKVRLQATIVIQCYTRGMFARSLARQSRAQLAWNRQFFLDEQARERAEREALRAREVERRMHPKNAADFETLYNELEAWRIAEMQKIETGGMADEEKQAARYELLLKEIKLVQTIDKLKAGAQKKMTQKIITKELETMSSSKLWEMSDGTIKEVQTPATRRAKELADLYHGLNLTNLRVDERLDVLLHVKWTVKDYGTKLTKELTELIDREADLLNRGRGDKALEGLRKRIMRAFLQLIRDPSYNPEAANLVNPVPL